MKKRRKEQTDCIVVILESVETVVVVVVVEVAVGVVAVAVLWPEFVGVGEVLFLKATGSETSRF